MLILQREDNKFDSNAILILNEAGKKLGYIPEKDQIVEFIEKNYGPAKNDHEKKVDEIIKEINRLNPATLEYYYRFPHTWEDNGLAQKIRDIWDLPTLEEYESTKSTEMPNAEFYDLRGLFD